MKFLHTLRQNPSLRYLTPFCVFIVMTSLQTLGNAEYVFWIYAAKVILTGLSILVCFQGYWNEIQGKFSLAAVGLGIVVFVIWILPETLFPQERPVEFNPNLFSSALLRNGAIFFRLLGACLIVPFVEEVVWRSFVMRFLIQHDFLKVPLGTYTHFSFWISAISFALMHAPWNWGVAIIAGVAYGGYLVKTKNLAGCILAHGTTNLALGIYVLITGQWKFW